MNEIKLPVYSELEEKINVYTHLVGALIAIAALPVMVTLAALYGNWATISGSAVFGATLIWMYVNSTLYHNEKDYNKRVVRQKLDHTSVNILIAGSNTFYLLGGLNDTLGYILTGVVWALSLISIAMNAVNVKKFRVYTMIIYMLTGWLCIIFVMQLIEAITLTGFLMVLAGGVCYTIGTIIYGVKRNMMHAIWHFFVLAGSIFHIAGAIYVILL